jgi:PPOX class probable F420-dependent enzyme
MIPPPRQLNARAIGWVVRPEPARIDRAGTATTALNRPAKEHQPMRTMSPDERRRFLSERPRTMKVATVRPDGRPHVAPVWFALDGDDVIFTTGENTVKGTNLRRDPRVCLCVDDDMPPFAYVQIDGVATLTDDLPALLHWATIIGGRYMGIDHADAFGRRNAVPGELLVRVTPTRILARAGIAD